MSVVSWLATVALIAATTWAVLAAGWVSGGGGAVVVAVISVSEAALLAQARAPRIAVAIAAPFLGLAAILPTTVLALPAIPRETAGTVVSHYISALVSGLSSTKDWDFTVGLCAVLFLCGYWLGWAALREHRGVLAVVPVFSVLATNVVNAKNPDAVALPETIAVWLSLAVIAAVYLGSLSDRWAFARVTPLHGLEWRFTSSAAGVAVGLTVLALLIPAVSTIDISGFLFTHAGSSGAGGSGVGSGESGAATIGFSSSVDLGGPLVSQPRQVLSYRVSTAAPVYLRVLDETVFDHGDWKPGKGATTQGGFGWAGVSYGGWLLPRDDNPADGGVSAEENAVHASLVLDERATGNAPRVPFTGEPEAVNRAGTAYGVVGAPGPTPLLTVDSVQLNQNDAAGTAIQTIALISTATGAQLRAAGTNYPAWALQYIALADGKNHEVERIKSLAALWTAGATDPYDQALAIEQHLRNPQYFTYTLRPPKTPAGVWGVVYFLTQSHRGYCQYFASAMGSMLRSLDIPSRLVNGYGPGTSVDTNRPQVSQGQQHLVTTSDAHTWVEAYFPRYGWIPFEPTPPSSEGDYQPFPRGQAAITTNPIHVTTGNPGHTVEPARSHGVNPPVPPAKGSPTGVSGQVAMALGVLGGVAVVAVAALLWMVLPRTLTSAWRRVETLGVLSGLDRRDDETHRAYAARLGRSRPRAGPALTALATVIARAEFSAAGVSEHERSLALRTWRRAFFAAAVRPGRSLG
ncbi:MAG: transglutaminaseTgpA domain-containing protein [Candidatus Dormiibacterota bacterium]